jgi:hypothetical protein
MSLFFNARSLLGPWTHLASATACGYIGYNLKYWEDELAEKVNDERELRGMKRVTRLGEDATLEIAIERLKNIENEK